MRKKIVKIKEDELKAEIVQLKKEKEQLVTVYRFIERFSGAQNLEVGDIIKHIRTAKVVSIKFIEDKTYDVVLEKIKGSWESVRT